MADELPADRPAPADATADPSSGAAGADPGDALADRVTRSVVVEADVAEVWRAVTDPGERALWLDDPDAAARHVRIDESAPDHRLVWTWWHPGDEGGASTVSVVLAPAEGGGTRVVVTETAPVAPRSGPSAALSAGTRPLAVSATRATAARRAPAWLRCAADRWDGRLLGLELRFVAARVLVA
ncbi:MAG TPA: SRPBCC domain-containing protein [Acidimicrobiales bacterium]